MPKDEHKPVNSPPKKAERLLQFFLKEELAEEVLGDLEEKFHVTLREKSAATAKRNYWFQVLNYVRPFAVKNLSSPTTIPVDMYKHYFKVGFRNLKRNKGYSLINIGGLAVGMAVAMLIGLWIQAELSYNKYHENYDRIAQVMQHQTYNGKVQTQEVIPFPLGPELQNKYDSDFDYVVMATFLNEHILSFENKTLIQKGNYMDVDGPRLLSLNMIAGNRDGLQELGSILLSASTAKAFFGELDPIGKAMKIDNEVNAMVTGIYEDLPFDTQFEELSFVASWELYVSAYDWVSRERENPHWNNNSYLLYAQIAEHANMDQLNRKIRDVKYDHLNEAQQATKAQVFLHPMEDWHLRSNWQSGVKKGGFIQYIWLFGMIGVFVLLLACINFMNLSTAQSERRAKEVGVRKSVGSARLQLVNQFLSESFLVVIIGFVLAGALVLLCLPSFNQLADKQLVFPYKAPFFWLTSLIFIICTGLLAGSYPALYLSSFRPVKVLKGTFKASTSATLFRRVLVVVQFTVSITLIICTIMVEKQVQHSKNRPLGYDSEGLIMIGINTPDYEGKYDLFREELKKERAITEMAVSSSPLTAVWNGEDGFHWEGKAADFNSDFAVIWIDHDYGKTIGWDMVAGRDFSQDFSTDSTAFIVNEAAIEYMGLEDPIGKTIRWGSSEHKIIGVVKDMLMESPFEVVKQAIYLVDTGVNTNWITLKLNPTESVGTSLAIVEEVFTTHAPAVPFEFKFADQEYARKFIAEERIRKLSGIFALLAIFISCLGLFGLAAFMAAQRTKEIGIRKVLGATVLNLWQLLSKDFMFLIVLSCLIAIPIAYLGVQHWLANYDYRTEISWWIFAGASLMALTITLLTVSFQAIKASLMDPVKSLRSE